MKQGIPERIKLFKFASRSMNFSHIYQVKDFPRIGALVSNVDAPVNVELDFSLVDHKIPCIKGKIKLNVALTCQRCLNDVSIRLQPNFQLAFL